MVLVQHCHVDMQKKIFRKKCTSLVSTIIHTKINFPKQMHHQSVLHMVHRSPKVMVSVQQSHGPYFFLEKYTSVVSTILHTKINFLKQVASADSTYTVGCRVLSWETRSNTSSGMNLSTSTSDWNIQWHLAPLLMCMSMNDQAQ